MEVQMAAQAAKSMGRSTPPHHHGGGGGAKAKPVPGYLRPPAGSCHHVCKYGGTHAFEEKEATKKPHPKPRKQKQQPPPPAAAESQSRVMVKMRSVFRRRVGDSSRAAAEKVPAAAGKAKGAGESVEWKDIVAYDTTVPTRGSSPQPDKVPTPVAGSGDAKKKDATTKGKKSHGKASKITGQVDATQDETLDKKSAKPPKGKKPMAALLVDKMAIDQDLLHGYQTLSPSLMQSRASLLRDLEQEIVRDGAANAREERAPCSLDEEELAAAAAEASRPIPAHRRVKSMGIGSSSRSARHPFARQASKNSSSGVFKLRSSRSTRAPTLPAEEEKPARLRSRRGEDASSGSAGRGIQLRIRSLRRRGVGGSGGPGASAGGFVVPAVALRHQKTLEKKRSQRLYNNLLEETASKLVKARKSRVKALVGAFESVISKIAK
ncbi:uncharacterized protein C2845_PM05G16810 [Panicum miliaceum]|uniref:Calmodulin-binding domain-containing protein n=1 Tax=Panicum miliaceum TaxID=4540 RepID=A0A3L6SUR8_PANMI|nr:uncharacterized protein C2845_PM05G16810 [Panicum miliaceum]